VGCLSRCRYTRLLRPDLRLSSSSLSRSLQAGSASGHSAARARCQMSRQTAPGTGDASGMTTRQRGAVGYATRSCGRANRHPSAVQDRARLGRSRRPTRLPRRHRRCRASSHRRRSAPATSSGRGACPPRPRICHTCRCLSIEAAHVGDLIITFFGRLVGGERKPISNQVWFEIGFF
jgi:hypothetical protein